MMFKENDRVRFREGVPQASCPDRRNKIGTVQGEVKDGTSLPRISVLFDGEETATGGIPEAAFELAN